MQKILIFLGVFTVCFHAMANESMLWSCKKGQNASAVTISVNPNAGEFPYVLKINDAQIIAALGFGGTQFMSIAKDRYNNDGTPAGYEALAEEYASGVDFLFDNGGIKLISVYSTGEGIQREPSTNWYFNPGECLKLTSP